MEVKACEVRWVREDVFFKGVVAKLEAKGKEGRSGDESKNKEERKKRTSATAVNFRSQRTLASSSSVRPFAARCLSSQTRLRKQKVESQ